MEFVKNVMDIESFLKDKNIKPKAKTEDISQMLLDGIISIKALINVAKAAKTQIKQPVLSPWNLQPKPTRRLPPWIA